MDRAENKMNEIMEDLHRDQDDDGVISHSSLMKMEFSEAEWVVERIVPHQCISIISGAPASFKTWLMLQMAITIAKGEDFLGKFKCTRHNVLMIDEENHSRRIQKRMRMLDKEQNLPLHFYIQKGFLVDDDEWQKKILKICEKREIDVIFMDSLVRIHTSKENDATQMNLVYKKMQKLCQAGKTIIFSHHERKEGYTRGDPKGRVRGSSDILAGVDAHISLSRKRNNKKILIVDQSKTRDAEELDSFEIGISNDEEMMQFEHLGAHDEIAYRHGKIQDIIIEILTESPTGMAKGEIAEKVRDVEKIGYKTVQKILASLIKSGRVLESPGEKNEHICSLPPIEA